MNGFLESAKYLFDWLLIIVADISESMGSFFANFGLIAELYTLAVRWVFPILAVIIFLRCVLPLLREGKSDEVWGYLSMNDGTRIPLKHWEVSIGRSKLSDVVLDPPFVSRSHAVLTFREGTWSIADLKSKNGVEVNGARIEEPRAVKYGDIISIAGLKMELVSPGKPPVKMQRQKKATSFVATGKHFKSSLTFMLILLFQILGGMQIFLSMGAAVNPAVPLTFFLFILAECAHYMVIRWRSRNYLELELLCYFLCGLNLFIVASATPDALLKQLGAILLGIVMYTVLVVLIRDLGRARRLKYLLMASALVLLVLNLAIGETHFGARRWIDLGFISFQPSEFVKIAFVLAGTATLDRLLTTRNMTAFIGFSGACIIALILTKDFGSVVVFFTAFIVIAFMRSGDLRTVAFTTAGAVLGTLAAVSFMPYIASRFATWGSVWDFASTSGYQQTRTMIAAASGGLLGVGGGEGYFSEVVAADTDLVFGMLSEEWGLLVALTIVLVLVFFAFYAVFLIKNCRSSFYAIAACGAGSIFLVQVALNVLGSVDILPLTGITMPFVSNGGSSMVASWGLLAFIKSADGRTRPGRAYISGKKGD